MAKIKIPYLVAKGASWYWTPGPQLRARGWKNVPLGKDQARAEAKARQLNTEAAADAAPARHTGPMTVRQLIQRWQASPHYNGVRAGTRRDYAYRCRVVDDWCGDAELPDLTRGLVKAWHKACHQQHAAKANRALQMLRGLYDFAIDHEWCATNPADKVKPLPAKPRPVQDWTADQIRHMTAIADASTDGNGCALYSVGTAILLNEWLGQRLKDILLMEAVAIRGGVWHLVQSKTEAELFLPIGMVPGLSERIAGQQARNRAMGYQGERIIISEATGQPYLDDEEGSTDHFSRRFARVRTLAADTMPDCGRLTFQKLRRFANIEAEDAGVSDSQSNSVGGWRDGSTAKARYRARTLRQAESVFEARLNARGEAVGT